MPSTVKDILRWLAPPIIVEAYRAVLAPRQDVHWRYLRDGWPPASDVEGGWDHPSVLTAQLAEWQALISDAAAPHLLGGRSSVADSHVVQSRLITFAYVLGRTAAGRDQVSILDWGSGLGQYALFAKSLFPEVVLDYSCYDRPMLAEAGRRLLPWVTFHSEEATVLGKRYDVVIASGSLQYVHQWRDKVAEFATVAGRFVYVTRLPVVLGRGSFAVMQRPPRRAYATEFPAWFLNRTELVAAAADVGLVLDREFLVDEAYRVPGAPEQPVVRGFLFKAACDASVADAPATH